MEIKYPMISVYIPCYNNQQYLKECINSIFQQSYSNIEIVIGDDGSREFDEEGLRQWIEKNRTPNITNFKILANKINRGTVANNEHMQRESSGEYLLGIAADDILYDENVLEALYLKLIESGAEFIVTQTEMWNQTLDSKIGEFWSPKDIEFIKNSTAQQLYEECCYRALLPASYLFKRTLLDKIGNLSDKYRLVEDYPFQLRATRLGIKPAFLDIPSTIKHRHGGISHGQKSHTSRTVLIYHRDCIWSYINEVLPYEDMLSENGQKRAREMYVYNLRLYNWIHYPDYLEGLEEEKRKARIAAKKSGKAITESSVAVQDDILKVPEYQPMSRSFSGLVRDTIKIIVYRLSKRRAIRKTFFATLVLSIATCLTLILLPDLSKVMGLVLVLASAFGVLFGICQLLMAEILKIRHRRWKESG